MNPVLAFTVIMAIWTVSEFLSAKSKGLVSSLFVASIIFLVGFLTGLFPADLLTSSSLLALAGVVVGFVIVHLGTVISIDDFIKQWRTVLTGIGATVSVVIIQEAALAAGLATVAVFPVLIASLQGLVGFPLTSVILRKEALRLRDEYRAGNLKPVQEEAQGAETKTRLPAVFQSTVGTLFVVGVTVVVARFISDITNGNLNTFVVALILGVLLRWLRIFKPSVLSGIDAYGLMLTAVLILVFGPLATVTLGDLKALALPLAIAFVVGVAGIVAGSVLSASCSASAPRWRSASGSPRCTASRERCC